MMNNLIRLSKSCIGAAEKEAVMNVLDNEYLGMGQKVKDFEYLLSEYFGPHIHTTRFTFIAIYFQRIYF